MVNKKRGFTLIELLVVIAIIGILSAVVLSSLSSARNKGKDASAKSSINAIRASAEIYYNSGTNSYGTAGSGTVTSAGVTSGLTGACADADVTKLLTAGAAQAGQTATCVVGLSGGSYVAYVQLNGDTSPAMFCVDSSGFSGASATNAAGFANAVGAAVKCK